MTKTLFDLKEKHIGPIGSELRDKYELELSMDVIGQLIKQKRKELNMTQEELGKLVGVQKAYISKLESSVKNITLLTMVKIFQAMDMKIKFSADLR